MKLYEISEGMAQVIYKIEQGDIPLEQQADLLEQMDGAFDEKAVNVAAYIKNVEADVSAIQDAIANMKRRMDAKANAVKTLKDYLKHQMEKIGHLKIEVPEFVISVRKSPPSVQVDENKLPHEWLVSTITYRADKPLIKQALQDRVDIPGAKLVHNTNLQIK